MNDTSLLGADGFDPETKPALLKHSHHLEPRDRCPRCFHGPEAEGRADRAWRHSLRVGRVKAYAELDRILSARSTKQLLADLNRKSSENGSARALGHLRQVLAPCTMGFVKAR